MEGDPTCNFAMCVCEQKRVCRWFFSNAALFMPLFRTERPTALCPLWFLCSPSCACPLPTRPSTSRRAEELHFSVFYVEREEEEEEEEEVDMDEESEKDEEGYEVMSHRDDGEEEEEEGVPA